MPAGRPAHALDFLLGGTDQAVSGHVERRVGILRRLLDLDRPGTGHAQREVALLVGAPLATPRVAELDAKLGRLVVVEALELGHDVFLSVVLDARGKPHLLALDDHFHDRQCAHCPDRCILPH